MVSRTILIIAGLLAATSVLAEAYKWVDEDGGAKFLVIYL